jgi:hypothetical protein
MNADIRVHRRFLFFSRHASEGWHPWIPAFAGMLLALSVF